MSHVSCRSLLRSLPVLLAALTLLPIITAAPALAQLTAAEISDMQHQAAAQGATFEVGPNDATQYSLDQLCGLREPANWRDSARFVSFQDKGPIPQAFDWRVEAGGLPPIRNQGGCGSCWAFGTVGPLECAIKIQDGEVVNLSEQWLVSCNRHGWDCGGGWWAHGYHFVVGDACDSSGAVLEADYPYTATDPPCVCPDPHPYHISDWAYIGDPNGVPSVSQMKMAILQHGPISVAVAVDSWFQSYNGGVFNRASTADINHAVTLVGWDDALGASGAWIMRNSWGTNWGEDGYMYIAYGVCSIGYGACFIEYNGGISFTSDIQSGWAPYDVNFQGQSGLNLTNWSWDFGDGSTANGQTPIHTYANPGTYSVSVTAYDSLGNPETRERINYIMALADTVRPGQTGGVCNSDVVVPISIRNSVPVRVIQLPITYSGPVYLVLDSVSRAGCRTDYFESLTWVHADPINRRMTIKLTSSDDQSQPYLEEGEGPVVKLYFSIPEQECYGDVTPIDVGGYLSYTPYFSWPLLNWTPATNPGGVTLAFTRGDCDGNSSITVADLTYLVSFLFRDGATPNPLLTGDLNCSETVNVQDVTYMVNYLFRGGNPPAMCF